MDETLETLKGHLPNVYIWREMDSIWFNSVIPYKTIRKYLSKPIRMYAIYPSDGKTFIILH
jgi:hypothetical protein